MNRFLFICFLFHSFSFSLIHRTDIINDMNGVPKIIAFGDKHDLGNHHENLNEAFAFSNFIHAISYQDPTRPIVIILESSIYAPDGLTTQQIEEACSETIDLVSFTSLHAHRIYGKPINDEMAFYTKYLGPSLGYHTWMGLNYLFHMPLLKALSRIPNVKLHPTDPRFLVGPYHTSLYDPSKVSSMDVFGYPRSFRERYDETKLDIIEPIQKNYFHEHCIHLPRHFIGLLKKDLSSTLGIPLKEICDKPIQKTQKKQTQFFLEAECLVHLHNHPKASKIETLFDSEILRIILEKQQTEPRTLFIAVVGSAHNLRLVQALKHIDWFNAHSHSKKMGRLDTQNPFEHIQLAADLYKLSLKPTPHEIFKSIKDLFENEVLTKENRQRKVDELLPFIETAYQNNQNPTDEKGYSLLGYLCDFENSFIQDGSAVLISNLAQKIIKTALHAGANPNVIDPDGKTPFIRTLYNLPIHLMDPDTLQSKNRWRKVLKTHALVLEELIKHGADFHFPIVNALLKYMKNTIWAFKPIQLKMKYPSILVDIESQNDMQRVELMSKRLPLNNFLKAADKIIHDNPECLVKKTRHGNTLMEDILNIEKFNESLSGNNFLSTWIQEFFRELIPKIQLNWDQVLSDNQTPFKKALSSLFMIPLNKNDEMNPDNNLQTEEYTVILSQQPSSSPLPLNNLKPSSPFNDLPKAPQSPFQLYEEKEEPKNLPVPCLIEKNEKINLKRKRDPNQSTHDPIAKKAQFNDLDFWFNDGTPIE